MHYNDEDWSWERELEEGRKTRRMLVGILLLTGLVLTTIGAIFAYKFLF